MSEIKQIWNDQSVWCEEDGKSYPEIIEEDGQTYKLDPATWTYLPLLTVNYTDEEQELMNQPIGSYGRKWQEFMQENYPFEIAPMETRAQFGLIARKVDKEAQEMYELLTEQWAESHQPRPTTFAESAAWEKMKILECKRAVMEDVVLKHRGI